MQVTSPHCGRLGLALVVLLVWGASVQGYPMRKANFQWVRCHPNSNSANCIKEKRPAIMLSPGEANRILPVRADLTSRTRLQNVNDVFPISEDFSGSGSDSGSGSGSGDNSDRAFLFDVEDEFHLVKENGASDYKFRLKRNLLYGEGDLDQNAPEENFII